MISQKIRGIACNVSHIQPKPFLHISFELQCNSAVFAIYVFLAKLCSYRKWFLLPNPGICLPLVGLGNLTKMDYKLKLSVWPPLQVGRGQRVPNWPSESSLEVVQEAPDRRNALAEDFQPKHRLCGRPWHSPLSVQPSGRARSIWKIGKRWFVAWELQFDCKVELTQRLLLFWRRRGSWERTRSIRYLWTYFGHSWIYLCDIVIFSIYLLW